MTSHLLRCPSALPSTPPLCSPSQLDACEYFLLYLTSATWTSGAASEAYTREVDSAQRKGVQLLPVHEFPSVIDDDPQRGACDFNDMWKAGWTPEHLLTGDTNVYKQIAIALKPGRWRKAGLATVVSKMVKGGGERKPVATCNNDKISPDIN